jgi:hypothetical protein
MLRRSNVRLREAAGFASASDNGLATFVLCFVSNALYRFRPAIALGRVRRAAGCNGQLRFPL